MSFETNILFPLNCNHCFLKYVENSYLFPEAIGRLLSNRDFLLEVSQLDPCVPESSCKYIQNCSHITLDTTLGP